MTETHSGRANGDSFFTVEDLIILRDYALCMIRRMPQKENQANQIESIYCKINKEIEYIKSINVS